MLETLAFLNAILGILGATLGLLAAHKRHKTEQAPRARQEATTVPNDQYRLPKPAAAPTHASSPNVSLAGPGRRFLSMFIDFLAIQLTVLFVGTPFSDPVTGELSDGGGMLLGFAVIALFITLAMWASRTGRSFGKAITGCAVVKLEDPTQTPNFFACSARLFIAALTMPWGLIALATGRGQSLDDMAAGTCVIRCH